MQNLREIKREIKIIEPKDFPELLKHIPDPPKTLHLQGTFPRRPMSRKGEEMKYLTVVGSRKYSQYGKEVCEYLIEGLKGYPICIISGLALGIDSIAHRSAIKSGLKTVAVPGSGLSDKVLYPRSHLGLRDQILENDGCILSEFENDFRATQYSFPQRNRIMTGLCNAVLVIEAEIKSGTLITSKFATEYNRDVLTIPHNIFSKSGEGPHMLLKLGAKLVTKPADILECLGFDVYGELFNEKNREKEYADLNDDEKEVINILREPKSKDEIIELLNKPVHITQTILSVLEIKGLIKEEMGEVRLC
jgi:DNA processing protein